MRKILTAIVLSGIIALSPGIHSSYASEVDALLQKLIDKGILTAPEAQQIRTETNEEIAKTEKQKLEDYKQTTKDNLPDWVKNTKLTGDFRLRYQYDKDKGQVDQSRARIRARLGVISQINDKLEMGVGIATGKSSDPRTRNVTLGTDAAVTNTPGSAKTILLDYAYAKYTPVNGVSIIGGKYINPLWQPHDMFWDPNITPEGAALTLKHDLNSRLQLFMNNMFYWLTNDARTDTKWPVMFVFQPGATFKINNTTNLKGALAYYKFDALKNRPKFANSAGTNTFINGNYAYNYDSVQPSVELSFKEPFHGLLPFASIFGDYMYNTSLPSNATGAGAFDVGIKFGNESVSDARQWQARLVYSKLGRDAWLDNITNVDRYYPGRTNSKDYEAILDYGLGKNTWLRLRYYYAESLSKVNDTYTPENTLQLDWNMKF
ncbi:MAG: putative porin [Candidatus Omnitrophota bacterium]|jgi:hypothetical protein